MASNNLYLFLDLEMNQPSQKIIEIGIVIADITTKEIKHKQSIIVNPSEQLNPYIIELTGIKQSDVDNGITLIEAAEIIKDIQAKYSPFINPVTWGQGDKDLLELQVKEQISIYYFDQPEKINELGIKFGRREIDVKTLYVCYNIANDKSRQGGLAKSMTKLGLKFKGTKHRAADDAENTYYMFLKLLEKLKE